MNQFRAWMELDFEALASNLKSIRQTLAPETGVIAVVKANAYGHGAAQMASELVANGVSRLAVATVREGVELREAQIVVPILVLSPFLPHEIQAVVSHRLSLVVGCQADLQILIRDLERIKPERPVSVHCMLNTGMNRYGFDSGEYLSALELIQSAPHLKLEALMTHFQYAESEASRRQQRQWFFAMRQQACERALAPRDFHLANSAGTLLGDTRGDSFVRPGLALYGIDPTGQFAEAGVELSPVLSVKSRLAHIREVKKGAFIGYGQNYRCDRDMRVAIVTIGYGDGWPYAASNNGEMIVQDTRCPIIGSVMMDAIAIDVSHVPTAEVGSEVTLIGRQGFQEISAREVADLHKTLVYQIPCQLGQRLSRVYCNSLRARLQQTG